VRENRLAQLEEERDFLLSSLSDLEHEFSAGDVDEADYFSLRDSYTARAATLIREIAADDAQRETVRLGWKPFAWGALVVVIALAAGLTIARTTGERLAGQGMNGPIEDGSVSSLLVQARSQGMSNIPTGLDLYSRVLAIEPENIEALTYFGWLTVLSSSQEADTAVAVDRLQNGLLLLRQATIIDDGYPDAHCFLGITFFRFLDDAQAAQPEMRSCLEANPPAAVASMVAGLSDQIDAAVTESSTPSP
jgi:hypothetical protein